MSIFKPRVRNVCPPPLVPPPCSITATGWFSQCWQWGYHMTNVNPISPYFTQFISPLFVPWIMFLHQVVLWAAFRLLVNLALSLLWLSIFQIIQFNWSRLTASGIGMVGIFQAFAGKIKMIGLFPKFHSFAGWVHRASTPFVDHLASFEFYLCLGCFSCELFSNTKSRVEFCFQLYLQSLLLLPPIQASPA